MWENHPFHWASRVHGWVYDPCYDPTNLFRHNHNVAAAG